MSTPNQEAELTRVSVTFTCPECHKSVNTKSSSYVKPPHSYKVEEGTCVICHGCGNVIRVKVTAKSDKF